VYPHQAERLAAELEREGLDALVAASPASVAYVTGFWSLARSVDPTVEIYAVVTRRATALVVPAMDALAVVEGDAEADHVVCHGRFVYAASEHGGEVTRRLAALLASPAATAEDGLAAALAAAGAPGGRVGLDDAALPAGRATAIARRLGHHTVVPASAALARARAVKGPYEIDCLQRALHLSEESIDAVLDLLRPGVSEREAVTALEHETTRRGGRPYRTIVAFGPGAAVPAPWPTDRALRNGDLVRIDVGCTARGHRSNVARMAVLAEPSAQQQAVFDALHAGLETALETLRPGVTGAAVHESVVTTVRKAGLPAFDRHHVGHGIGLDPAEAPWLAPGCEPIEMGMVLCAETPYYVPGEAGLTLTETALITRDGAHVLNRSHRGLIVLD
jgi:Xaa-Pro aminopeptidase